MLSNIEKLHVLAHKPRRLILGLMSGTSLDGLDIALCSIEGNGTETKLQLLNFETVAYSSDFKQEVKSVFSKKEISLEKLTMLNPWIALQHAAMINSCLQNWKIKNDEIDLIASHGQTIYHAPKTLHQQPNFGNATLQIGDGDHLAVATGIITISDFRQKNIAAGGEGAPLAVYGDYLLFADKNEDRLLLNIGGIANFTYLPANDNSILCTDTGPGNTLMDVFIRSHFAEKFCDENALQAKAGKLNESLLQTLVDDQFFKLALPKTTGPELFSLDFVNNAISKSNTTALSVEDVLATLNKFSALTIVDAIRVCIKEKEGVKIFVSGGGVHNPLLMQNLKELLSNCSFHDINETGINPDAKEAVLFALLANECVSGNNSVFTNKVSGIPSISLGKISFPN